MSDGEEENLNAENSGPNQGRQNPQEASQDTERTAQIAAEQAAQSDIIRTCTDAVETYRRGELTKPVVVSRLGAQLSRKDAGLSTAQANAALASYLDMLAECDREQEQREAEKAPQGAGEPPTGAQGADQGTRTRSPHGRMSQQARSHIEIEESRSGSPDSVNEPASKRSKLDTSSFPWAQHDEILSDGLAPELRESLKLLRVYATDVKGTKLHLINSVGAPEFPDSEWNNILLGRAVDLDRVFTGHYSASAEEPRSESVGELEIRFKPASAAKHVTTSGEWVLAWNKASAATAYAFPHRRVELAAYGDHIIALFGALAVPLHHRILEFDRAVRKRVGARRDLLLTDFVRFADLKIQFLDSAGANVYRSQESRAGGSGGGGAKPGQRGQKDACKRWNAGNCPSMADDCRYKHVCASCGAGGHTKPRCPKNPH